MSLIYFALIKLRKKNDRQQRNISGSSGQSNPASWRIHSVCIWLSRIGCAYLGNPYLHAIVDNPENLPNLQRG